MKALDTFLHPVYKHNCAQAVANHWYMLYPAGRTIIDSYAHYIGGHAPGGLCGALYAAIQAVPDHAEEIKREFAEITGATTCREIKGSGRTPCQICVDTADQLVARYTERAPQ